MNIVSDLIKDMKVLIGLHKRTKVNNGIINKRVEWNESKIILPSHFIQNK